MENTLENKAKFFAQYWGQDVMVYNGKYITPSDFIRTPAIYDCYLELKPLPPISDEDALQVSKIVNKIFPKASSIEDGKKFIEKYTTRSVISLNLKRVSTLSHVEHYLRSRGYALPFMGLSVEELVNRRWVKLKGETK